MSVKTLLVGMLAVVCGLSAALGVTLLRKDQPLEVKAETATVLVATIDLARGRVVTKGDVKVVRDWPKDKVPPGALTEVDQVVDRTTLVPIPAGDLMFEAKVAPRDAGRGLAALVPTGMRAYTIQTSRIASGVAGFVMPGNHVDVLLNLRCVNPNDESGGGSTTTLLQDVEILAVDQRLDAPADNKVNPRDLGSVTLKVTAEQAALLDLGQNMGQLTLSLRNPEDRDEARARPATLADIRFRQEKPGAQSASDKAAAAPKAEEPEVLEIVTLRGSQRGRVLVTAGHR
jgi:pilus assembly protein CpaB